MTWYMPLAPFGTVGFCSNFIKLFGPVQHHNAIGSTEEKVADIVNRPEYYADIVMGIRGHLAEKHSYEARMRELIQIVSE